MEKTSEKENIFLKIAKYLFPWKGDKPFEIARKIIFLAAAITLVITGVMLIKSFVERADDNEQVKEIAEIYHGTAASKVEITTEKVEEIKKEFPKIQEQFVPLMEVNKDIVGWISIGNEDSPFLDYPVVQCGDNDFYLNHNFKGEPSRSGTLFADYRDKITPEYQSANIVLYGHNMATGEYFGTLQNYFNYAVSEPDHNDISFYKRHPSIKFSTLYKTSTYKIFAGMLVNVTPDGGEVFRYHSVHDFANKTDFDNYCAKVLDRSNFINPDIDIRYGDNLLTLSTCILGTAYGDTELRFVIYARETRPGEDETVDVSRAYANPSPLFFDAYYATRGGKWEGRGWDESLIAGYKGKDH